MKMERVFPPSNHSQIASPLMIGEQAVFILCDASGAKLSDEERRELETLTHDALTSSLKSASGLIDDKTLQDAFEEANVRVRAAVSSQPRPVSALCVVKEEGAPSCLVASAGKCKLLRVDGDQVELAISHKGKDKPQQSSLGIKADPPLYLAKLELGTDEVLIALTEEAYKAQDLNSWKNRLASPETLSDEIQQALGSRGSGASSWILYPHEDSAPSLPPKRKGLTFSVSLILLACLAILGTSVWMKERRTLLGKATPPSVHAPEILVKQERKAFAANAEQPDWNFDRQELEIAQLRDAIQEVAETGGDESDLLKRIISAQEEKIAQMSDKESALAQKLESQDEYVALLQSSLALLQEEASGPADTLSLQLSEAIESKEMLERELESIAAHTALLDQHREEVARLRNDAAEYQEAQEAYEEVLRLCAIQSENLAVLENKVADDELSLHKVREELSGQQSEVSRLMAALANAEAAKEALQTKFEEERQAATVTQDQFLALIANSEVQEEQLGQYQASVEQFQQRIAATEGLEQRCQELTAKSESQEEQLGQYQTTIEKLQERVATVAVLEEECQKLALQIDNLNQEKGSLGETTEALQGLLVTQEAQLAGTEEIMLELQGELELTSEALATAETQLAMEQKTCAEQEALLATLQASEQESRFKFDETEGARTVLTQQIDELTESHRLLHGEKRDLEEAIEMIQADLLDRESRLAVAELEQKRLQDSQNIADEARKALHKENLELGQKIAALEKVEQDYEKEHFMRRESDEMLGRLATNIQGWKEAVSSMEESRRALADELAELKSYQASVVKGKVQKTADRSDKKPSVTRIHLVSPGETLEGIARRYYGTTKKISDIRDANEDLLADGQQVRVGTALVIP